MNKTILYIGNNLSKKTNYTTIYGYFESFVRFRGVYYLQKFFKIQ